MLILDIKGIKIGFVFTSSFCTFHKVIPKMKELKEKGAEIIPVMSFNSYKLDTKFGKAKDFIKEIEEITGKKIIHTITESETIRDVIAFPMNSKAEDLLMGAPGKVTREQLKDVHIKLDI